MFKIVFLQHFLVSIFIFFNLVTKYLEIFTFSAAKISVSQMMICFLQGIFLLLLSKQLKYFWGEQ